MRGDLVVGAVSSPSLFGSYRALRPHLCEANGEQCDADADQKECDHVPNRHKYLLDLRPITGSMLTQGG